jgi:hypothetical protein
MLVYCLHLTKEYVYTQPFEIAMDSNTAYTALKEQMLGATITITKALEAKADHQIRTLPFNGQIKGVSFDKFIITFTQAFLDCGVEYSEDKKVSLLLRAITDPSLQIACGQIQGSRDLKVDFTAAVAYIVDEVASRANSKSRSSRNVALFDRRGSHGSRGDGRGREGHGRSRCGGQSGCGYGRGNSRNLAPTAPTNSLTKWNPNQPGAYYMTRTYQRLTSEQCTKNYDARK